MGIIYQYWFQNLIGNQYNHQIHIGGSFQSQYRNSLHSPQEFIFFKQERSGISYKLYRRVSKRAVRPHIWGWENLLK